MKIALLQCPTGISGNMFIGAFADAGLDWQRFTNDLYDSLPISNYRLTKQAVKKNGLAATLVTVNFTAEAQHRHLQHIHDLLDRSQLPPNVVSTSKHVFQRLAEAEAAVHGCTVEQVHFHEVGAVDAIVDVVGSVLALHHLNIDKLYAQPLPMGTGFVQCDHGTIPVPAPATVKLMEGYPIAANPPQCVGELTTPTGAVLVTTLADFGPTGDFLMEKIGFGAGSKDMPVPNAARLMIGTRPKDDHDKICIIETNIDDMNPELYGCVMDKLLDAGALDVFYTAIYMKNNRPGTLVTVLTEPHKKAALLQILSRETSSIGFRFREENRVKAKREFIKIATSYGTVAVKVSTFDGSPKNVSPEYKDCLRLSYQAGVPVKVIYDEAKALALGYK